MVNCYQEMAENVGLKPLKNAYSRVIDGFDRHSEVVCLDIRRLGNRVYVLEYIQVVIP